MMSFFSKFTQTMEHFAIPVLSVYIITVNLTKDYLIGIMRYLFKKKTINIEIFLLFFNQFNHNKQFNEIYT